MDEDQVLEGQKLADAVIELSTPQESSGEQPVAAPAAP
jgi:hypothetical protein